jgi:hypothetical protein
MNGTDKPNGAEVDSRLSAEDALRISRHHPDYDTRVNAGLHAVKITKCRPDGPEQNLLHDWTLDRTLPEPVRIAAGKKAGAFLLKEMFLRKKTHAYIGYQLELIGDLIDKRGCYRQVHSTRMWDPDRDTPYYIYGSKARTDDPSYSNDITFLDHNRSFFVASKAPSAVQVYIENLWNAYETKEKRSAEKATQKKQEAAKVAQIKRERDTVALAKRYHLAAGGTLSAGTVPGPKSLRATGHQSGRRSLQRATG